MVDYTIVNRKLKKNKEKSKEVIKKEIKISSDAMNVGKC